MSEKEQSFTLEDIIKEFGIELREDYYARSKADIAKNLELMGH